MTSLRMVLACGALTIAAALSIAIPGCSTNDGGAGDGMDGATEANAPDPCDVDAFFTAGGNGGACFPVSNMACFAECTTGGCTCMRNPAGGDHGLWKCVVDLSCVPDSAPFDDGGNDGSTGSDADLDAGPDALDADDAG